MCPKSRSMPAQPRKAPKTNAVVDTAEASSDKRSSVQGANSTRYANVPDTQSHDGVMATALASAVHVDLDEHGRPSKSPENESLTDVEERQRTDALIQLGAISRRRSVVHDGDYVSSDLCGRGDATLFARIQDFHEDRKSASHAQCPSQPVSELFNVDRSNDQGDHIYTAHNGATGDPLGERDLLAIAHAQLLRHPATPANGSIPQSGVGVQDARDPSSHNITSEQRTSQAPGIKARLRRTKSHQSLHSKQSPYKRVARWFTLRRRRKPQ